MLCCIVFRAEWLWYIIIIVVVFTPACKRTRPQGTPAPGKYCKPALQRRGIKKIHRFRMTISIYANAQVLRVTVWRCIIRTSHAAAGRWTRRRLRLTHDRRSAGCKTHSDRRCVWSLGARQQSADLTRNPSNVNIDFVENYFVNVSSIHLVIGWRLLFFDSDLDPPRAAGSAGINLWMHRASCNRKAAAWKCMRPIFSFCSASWWCCLQCAFQYKESVLNDEQKQA